ncbi:tetratricopeptide repeat protein [Streptomyces sp. NPDC057575]|uniref:tetratricopeptide repeat protein n=1 Tax=unclassified Streptomyces TaxID=2593676 RepID=UPI0036B3ABB3
MHQESDQAAAIRLQEEAYYGALSADADYDELVSLRTELEASYRRTLETDPDDVDTLTGLGVLLTTLVQLPGPDAVELLERAFELDPSDEDACTNLATLLGEVGDEEEVDMVYQKALEAGNSNAAFELAARLDERGEVEEAEPLYRRAAEAGHADAMANLADLLAERGADDEVTRLFRHALAEGGSASLNQSGRSIAKYNTERAATLFQRLIEAGDDTARVNLTELTSPSGQKQ